MTRSPFRRLHLPAPDRSFWRAEAGAAHPLLYLAWGRRDFFAQGVPPTAHEGWVCAVVLEGTPTALLGGRELRLGPPRYVVAREDCAFGWRQDHRGESRILVWTWKKPCLPEFAAWPRDAATSGRLSASAAADFERLHTACRDEVLRLDQLSPAMLEAFQCQLEIAVLRQPAGGRPADKASRLVERGLDWMRSHLDSREPVARLADYLGVSQPTLHRLFRKAAGESPLSRFRRLRLDEARRLLEADRLPVKVVALTLGYAHTNDFCRAYRACFGISPGAVRSKISQGL